MLGGVWSDVAELDARDNRLEACCTTRGLRRMTSESTRSFRWSSPHISARREGRDATGTSDAAVYVALSSANASQPARKIASRGGLAHATHRR